jgi:hypothetical protein
VPEKTEKKQESVPDASSTDEQSDKHAKPNVLANAQPGFPICHRQRRFYFYVATDRLDYEDINALHFCFS